MNLYLREEKGMITEEKVWLKYYSEEAKNAKLPCCKAYDYMIERNRNRLDKPALHYYGRDISFREFIKQVDACANSFAALGVKEGDIVSFLTVAIPETIVAVYALNKIGAAANTVDPRMDVGSINRMIKGAKSRVLVVLDVAFFKLSPSLEELQPERVVVQSATGSLPLVKKLVKKIVTKTNVPYGERRHTARALLLVGMDIGGMVAHFDAHHGFGVVQVHAQAAHRQKGCHPRTG